MTTEKRITAADIEALRTKHGDDSHIEIVRELLFGGETHAFTMMLQPIWDDERTKCIGTSLLLCNPPSTEEEGLQVTGGMAVMVRDFARAVAKGASTRDTEMLKLIMETHSVIKEWLDGDTE